MKNKPMSLDDVLTPKPWRADPPELMDRYKKAGLLTLFTKLEQCYRRNIEKGPPLQAAKVKAKSSKEMEDALEEAIKSWDTTCKQIQGLCGKIAGLAKAMAKGIKTVDEKAGDRMLRATDEATALQRAFAGKFDSRDFESAIDRFKKGSKAGDDDDDDDDKRTRKTDKDDDDAGPPVLQAPFLKAAKQLEVACEAGAKQSADLTKQTETIRKLLDKHIREARGHERTLKGMLPVGGSKAAKAFAKRHYKKTQADLAKLEDTIARSTKALAGEVDKINRHIGDLEKAANGNKTVAKKLEQADKHVYLIGYGADLFATFHREVAPLPDQLGNGESLAGLKLKPVPGGKIAQQFKMLSRWCKTVQRTV